MEFLSQFDAKIVYIKGDDNTIADALSHLPTDGCNTSTADALARHPYDFCEDNDTLCSVASICLPEAQGHWETAKSLSSSCNPKHSINATLKITADKDFLRSVKAGYAEDSQCKTLPSAALSFSNLILQDGLWYISGRLVILRTGNL
ncbi:uncharacterized protein LACBIDRAFT_312527 [Laccaria bicolor S238N-H82]|uniref:Predicted protein n=1 Tax=Laccaria bicolor (strain S238N-H82 / ATCC MYA-4686) TaxID=486041 RepID=B0DWC3_LACBS|nr:uncharacterized protein LACBIDRAFT_312527 [Laccaria bicolor S238N-H82]EDR01164.1 predicted protein [Laccaria bicolor S238N-H82]|eukprot:XP_001888206.1 predicted protein [Laccaria bicolor S238N-H82]